MGIYDRDYYQNDYGQRGFSFSGQQRMMVTNVVIVTVAVFILDTLAGRSVSDFLALEPLFYRQPWKFYQLLSYGFVHAGVWHVGFNMLLLWMFGRVIEERWGRHEFLLFYLIAIVFSGSVWLVADNLSYFFSQTPTGGLLPLVGASGGVVAVFIIFVLYYPKQTVYLWGLIAMPAWVIGAVLIGINLFQGIAGTAGNTAWQAHLGGAAFAFLYLHFGWSFNRLLSSRGWSNWKFPRRGPKLRVHNPDDDLGDLAAEADRILDKVHRQGEQSLTGRERKTLEKYSRRVRDQRR
ncbi:MAG: rhomboid family intramembrane serine protease [Planctomycetota bacterium]